METAQLNLISLLLAMLCLVGQCFSLCKFLYLRQPPNSTLEGCSPYQNGVIWIEIDCAVRNQISEIRWFRKNTTGAVEDLELGNPKGILGEFERFSRYHHRDFFNQQYNPSYLGKYWCQVINITAA